MNFKIVATAVLAAATFVVGCEEGYDSTPTTTTTTPVEAERGIEVDVEADDTELGTRSELRQERRENLREAIDNVDVDVDRRGVDVNVGDGKDGVDVQID